MYLYGASGHGMVIKDILNADGVWVEAFVDDNPEIERFCSRPVIRCEDLPEGADVVISIGDNRVRRSIVEKLKDESNLKPSETGACPEPVEGKPSETEPKPLNFGKAIHPKAIVSDSAEIGEGTVVMPGAIINAKARIGRHCVINTGAVVDHECVIGDFVNICPRTTLCGNVHVGSNSQVCAGSVVIQGIHIGENTTVGAGSVVVKDVPDNVVAYGNPCKVIRENK